MDELPNRALAQAHQSRHFPATLAVEAGQEECIALAFRQPRQVRQSGVRLQSAFHQVLDTLGVHLIVGQRRLAGGRGVADRGVADDLVQPAAEVSDLGLITKRRKGPQKGLLDDVLGPAAQAKA
jgi:hypothetical protein